MMNWRNHLNKIFFHCTLKYFKIFIIWFWNIVIKMLIKIKQGTCLKHLKYHRYSTFSWYSKAALNCSYNLKSIEHFKKKKNYHSVALIFVFAPNVLKSFSVGECTDVNLSYKLNFYKEATIANGKTKHCRN